MQTFFEWFTHMENTKPFALVLYFVTFIAIIVYVFWGKQRGKHLEDQKYIPLDDDDNIRFK